MKLSTIFYSAVALLMFVMPLQISAQNYHVGEVKGIDVSISYSGYAYLDSDGLPVYKLGSIIKILANLNNISQRQYKNVEVRSNIRYAEDVSGIRWWLDNQYVEYKAGDLIPGTLQGWKLADLGPGELVKIQTVLMLPLEALPGKLYVELEMRHVNQGNNDEAAVFILYPYTKFTVTEQ